MIELKTDELTNQQIEYINQRIKLLTDKNPIMENKKDYVIIRYEKV